MISSQPLRSLACQVGLAPFEFKYAKRRQHQALVEDTLVLARLKSCVNIFMLISIRQPEQFPPEVNLPNIRPFKVPTSRYVATS